jgi:hypothetical protein
MTFGISRNPRQSATGHKYRAAADTLDSFDLFAVGTDNVV